MWFTWLEIDCLPSKEGYEIFWSTNLNGKCAIFTATITFKISRYLITEQLSKSSSDTGTRKQETKGGFIFFLSSLFLPLFLLKQLVKSNHLARSVKGKKKKTICYGRLHTLNQNERLKHTNIYKQIGGFVLPNCAVNMYLRIAHRTCVWVCI